MTIELHNIVLANVTLHCYKGICFADLTQNWWHIQILYIHFKVISLQYIVFSAFCCLQKTWFKALNQGSGRFSPFAEHFRSGLLCKSTKHILRQSSPAHALTTAMEQNCTAGCLSADIAQTLQCRVQQKTYFAEFWDPCYIPWAITSQNYEWKRENKLKCHFVIIYLKVHFPFSCKKCIQLNSLSGSWLFHITANFWLLSACVHKQWKLCFVKIFCIARVYFSNQCMGIYLYSVDAFWGGYVISWLVVSC